MKRWLGQFFFCRYGRHMTGRWSCSNAFASCPEAQTGRLGLRRDGRHLLSHLQGVCKVVLGTILREMRPGHSGTIGGWPIFFPPFHHPVPPGSTPGRPLPSSPDSSDPTRFAVRREHGRDGARKLGRRWVGKTQAGPQNMTMIFFFHFHCLRRSLFRGVFAPNLQPSRSLG